MNLSAALKKAHSTILLARKHARELKRRISDDPSSKLLLKHALASAEAVAKTPQDKLAMQLIKERSSRDPGKKRMSKSARPRRLPGRKPTMTYAIWHPLTNVKKVYKGLKNKDACHRQAVAWAKKYRKNVKLSLLSSNASGARPFKVTASGKWLSKQVPASKRKAAARKKPRKAAARKKTLGKNRKRTSRDPAWRDRLHGGLADKNIPSDFNAKELRRGVKVESEHTSNRHLQKEIAMDHLKEDPRYYAKLAKMERR
jgi:hypothetical protein